MDGRELHTSIGIRSRLTEQEDCKRFVTVECAIVSADDLEDCGVQ